MFYRVSFLVLSPEICAGALQGLIMVGPNVWIYFSWMLTIIYHSFGLHHMAQIFDIKPVETDVLGLTIINKVNHY